MGAITEAMGGLLAAVRAADAEALSRLYADDAVLISPLGGEVRGSAAIAASEQGLFDAFTEIAVDAGPVLSAGRTGALEVVVRAKHTGALDLGEGEPLAPTGNRIELPAVWCVDVGGDGRIVEERDYFDPSVLMGQLGLG